jgi:transposase, IS5 family
MESLEITMSQIEMICLDDLIPQTHSYRRFQEYLPRALMSKHLNEINKLKGADGYGIDRLFLCLLVQFMENLSDRELERYLQENTAAK